MDLNNEEHSIEQNEYLNHDTPKNLALRLDVMNKTLIRSL